MLSNVEGSSPTDVDTEGRLEVNDATSDVELYPDEGLANSCDELATAIESDMDSIEAETDAILKEADRVAERLCDTIEELAWGAVDRADRLEAMISDELETDAKLKKLDRLADKDEEACMELVMEEIICEDADADIVLYTDDRLADRDSDPKDVVPDGTFTREDKLDTNASDEPADERLENAIEILEDRAFEA